MHVLFVPTKKSILLKKEIQLISLSFDLPWQKEEKQNSETHVPFAFFLNKQKTNSELCIHFSLSEENIKGIQNNEFHTLISDYLASWWGGG